VVDSDRGELVAGSIDLDLDRDPDPDPDPDLTPKTHQPDPERI
jgi:hypothetical protein